jgi:hypothetical protein
MHVGMVAVAACLVAPASLAQSAVPTSEQETESPVPSSQTSPSLWLLSGFLSRHFAHRDQYDQRNTGLGLAVVKDDNWTLAGGVFRNSLGDTSRYAQVQWAPSALQKQWGDLRMLPSISLGVVDGYKVARDGKVFPLVLPLVKFEYGRLGMNFIYVPTIAGKVDGALAIQASLRIFQ